jgi:lon-related putative ATP-dependent protease
MAPPKPLPPEVLYRHCNPQDFSFETTAELEDFEDMVGQKRAVEAVRFGVEVDLYGYNLFVLGPQGTGRHSFIQRFLEQQAANKPTPSDWCYVNNFDRPRQPKAIELPAGWGRQLRQDLQQLMEEVHTTIPTAFESEDYRNRRNEIEKKLKQEQQNAFEEVRQHARERGLDIVETSTGFTFVPLRKGQKISPDEYRKLSEEEWKRWQKDIDELSQELTRMLQSIPRRVRKMREQIHQLDRDVALFAVGGAINDLVEKYQEFPKVVDHLKSLRNDVADNIKLFTKQSEEQGQSFLDLLSGQMSEMEGQESSGMRRYAVNVLIDYSSEKGAPVVVEDQPTYPELVGRIEYVAHMGTLVTDFTLIRAGALHRANGGYLVLDARKVLVEPFTWETLKRVLKSRQITIRSLAQTYSLISTVSLEPEPIPLNVKVVLIGDRLLYYLLQFYDPEFLELFKVAADFEEQMDRNSENVSYLAQLLGTLAKKQNLMPLNRTGMARLLEESARHAGDAEKLSTQIRWLNDILCEAHYWAKQADKDVIDAETVQQAIDSRINRSSRLRDQLKEEILRQTLLIDTEGQKIGQINGLAVLQLGEYWFAHPSRITARVSLGSGKVIDIEREVELGGPIHSKGVLILSRFLASHYVKDIPLSLSASLVFEQSYAGVEGDSASSAELCALLSAIAKLSLKQSLAVTGSVNQYGQIQAIGAVNEKIEGFFDICQARGLKGDQGVLIPSSNVKHLMVEKRVLDAVTEGQFHIYAVETIDQCLELLTGLEAGQKNEKGEFPDGTINQRIAAGLLDYAEKRRGFMSQSISLENEA